MTTITTSLQLNAGCSSNVMKQENELKSILFVKEEIKKKTFIDRQYDFVYKNFYRIHKAINVSEHNISLKIYFYILTMNKTQLK